MNLVHLAHGHPRSYFLPEHDFPEWDPLGMATHQVLIGQPGYLLLDAKFHLGLRGEQQRLAEGLLLLVQLLLQHLHLGLETFRLFLMLTALGLQLGLQQPAPGGGWQVTVGLRGGQWGPQMDMRWGAAKQAVISNGTSPVGRTPRGADPWGS